MLKLFYAPNTCSLASHIALEEAGAAYEAVRINTAQNEQRSAAYLAINPKGRVPALATDAGVITENPAILTYVAQTHPAAKLAPFEDAMAFARAQSFNSFLCSTVHVAHAHGPRGIRWADDPAALAELKRKVPETMAAGFALIEEDMLQGPFVLGEAFSICDAYLFTMANWLESDGVDPTRFPKVHAHRERVRARPAVARVLAQVAG